MEQGWVYVLVNSSMPGIAKVGRTARAPQDRAMELSGVTGVATPFIVAYEQEFADSHAAERAIHAELDRRCLRVSPNREFFACPPAEITRLLLQIGAEQGHPPAVEQAGPTADALIAAGDRALHGQGDALQDTGEAVRCYRLAAARGALEAFERLGRIYLVLLATRRDQASRRRALGTLKEGVRRGDLYCYCLLSELFALENHTANVVKCWALFFAAIEAPEQASARFAKAACRYVSQCLSLGIAPAHLPVLRQVSDAMVRELLAELDLVRAEPAERRRVAACLRWVHGNAPGEFSAVLRPIANRARRAWTALAA